MSITELRELWANNPETFYIEWIKRDPHRYAIARIGASWEDTRNILKRVKQGKATPEEGNFAKAKHRGLLKQMIEKNWVNKTDIKQYIIY
jgi:hypothetical protein